MVKQHLASSSLTPSFVPPCFISNSSLLRKYIFPQSLSKPHPLCGLHLSHAPPSPPIPIPHPHRDPVSSSSVSPTRTGGTIAARDSPSLSLPHLQLALNTPLPSPVPRCLLLLRLLMATTSHNSAKSPSKHAPASEQAEKNESGDSLANTFPAINLIPTCFLYTCKHTVARTVLA